MENKDRVLRHFENISDNFDGIYKKEQDSVFQKILDALFRGDILKRRMEIMLDLCGQVKDREILDIGCGPGRYAVELAKRGAKAVLGIDISRQMIGLAEDITQAEGLEHICIFENVDFLEKNFSQQFDIVVAAGVFDYISDPLAFLSKIKDVTKERVILSFPIKYTLLTPLRKFWLSLKNCPNFYYTKTYIKRLLESSGLKIISIHRIGSFLVNGNYVVFCIRR